MLSIIGLVILVVAAIQAYKAAKGYGRNGVAWALITFGIGFGIQIIIPLIFGIIYGIILAAGGMTSQQQMQEAILIPAVIVSIVCIVLSVGAVFLVLRYLSKVPEEKSFVSPPQPPENFV